MVTRTRSPKPVPSGRPEEEELQYRRRCNGKRARTLPRLRRDVAQPVTIMTLEIRTGGFPIPYLSTMVTRTRSPKPVPSGRPEEEELQYRRRCNGKRARTLPRLRRDVAQPVTIMTLEIRTGGFPIPYLSTMVTRTRSPKPVPSGRPEEEELQYRRRCNGKRARTLPRLRRDVAQPVPSNSSLDDNPIAYYIWQLRCGKKKEKVRNR
ncbi:hypothetical protein NDU88_001732 [Pleurodeles waltl]|uniref:Uncharacterized protein n=1 Tax=Pleurodeles waltl TaxID=8319 RepID=A0AAV7MNI3_PLEWA|nr:hypothetical protein NDU88_001732 [Pleurodeles waltl]